MVTKRLFLVLAVAVSVLLATGAGAVVWLNEDFNDGVADGWIPGPSGATTGTFSVTGGHYVGDAPYLGYGSPEAYTVYGQTLPSDWTATWESTWSGVNYTGTNYFPNGVVLVTDKNNPTGSAKRLGLNVNTEAGYNYLSVYGVGVTPSLDAMYPGYNTAGTFRWSLSRPVGANYLVVNCVNSLQSSPWDGASYHITFANPSDLNDLKYFGLDNYFSKVNYDNVLITSTVPEPASLFALSSGLLGLFGLRRRGR